MKRITLLILATLFLGSMSWAQGVYVDNVVVVLDCSGSMGERMHSSRMEKLDAAKQALLEVLRQVPDSTHIGLVIFSAKGVDTDWLYPLGAKDDVKLVAAISRPSPGGDTPLGLYIKIGADRLLAERRKQHGYGSYRLLIVTDGEETRDKGGMERNIRDVLSRGITVDVIGVDMSAKHTLATKVHSYRKADDPESLRKAVADVFAEVSGKADDSSATGKEMFDAIALLPDELAKGMIEALARSGNHPIGEKPMPQAAEQPTAGQQQPDAQSQSSKGWILILILVIVIMFLLFLKLISDCT